MRMVAEQSLRAATQGDQDGIAFFSNRAVDDVIYEILDENLAPLATFGMAEFKALLDAQEPQPSTAVA
ncbi:hypothetical protein [Methylocella sp.]|uniref:hypothetical protein n=1 Tax=Methylocella sp. TaxID=1978226 RepID=UPI0037851973